MNELLWEGFLHFLVLLDFVQYQQVAQYWHDWTYGFFVEKLSEWHNVLNKVCIVQNFWNLRVFFRISEQVQNDNAQISKHYRQTILPASKIVGPVHNRLNLILFEHRNQWKQEIGINKILNDIEVYQVSNKN